MKQEVSKMAVMNGAEIEIEKGTGAVVSLSTETTPDCNRWEMMPSVSEFASSLIVLNLHKARYIERLHSSVSQLIMLKKLVLTQCDRLATLPIEIGNLKSLEEVRNMLYGFMLEKLSTVQVILIRQSVLQLDLSDSPAIDSLPDSIGDLEK
jgi:hypothetical protein